MELGATKPAMPDSEDLALVAFFTVATVLSMASWTLLLSLKPPDLARVESAGDGAGCSAVLGGATATSIALAIRFCVVIFGVIFCARAASWLAASLGEGASGSFGSPELTSTV